MKILFLHGTGSKLGDVRASYLIEHGHDVLNPALPDDNFDDTVRIAQSEYDQGSPEVVVGSSRGGAAAMNMISGDTPLVLLCPAWKRYGNATKTKPNTTILHSKADERVPFSESEELVENSGLPSSALIDVGTQHRLTDQESLAAMLRTVEETARQREAIDGWTYISVAIIDDIPVVCFKDLAFALKHHEGQQVSQELCGLADQRQWHTLVLDFEGKPFNMGAYFLQQFALLSHKLKGRLLLCNVPQTVVKLFELALADHVRIFTTRERALSAAKS